MRNRVTIIKLKHPQKPGLNFQIKSITGSLQVNDLRGQLFNKGDILSTKQVDDIVNACTKNKLEISIQAE